MDEMIAIIRSLQKNYSQTPVSSPVSHLNGNTAADYRTPMARNYNLRSSMSKVTTPAYKTPKMSLNQWRKSCEPNTYGWWNHDTHELKDDDTVVLSKRYTETFAAGDAFTLTVAMRFGAKLLRSYMDADNSASDWAVATEVHEYKVSSATMAYEDQLIKRAADAKRAKVTPKYVATFGEMLLERVTTTGSSGLGKARRKTVRCA